MKNYELREKNITNQICNMTSMISSVKSMEQDLVSKEKKLEKKINDVLAAANHTGEWGVDQIHQQPLNPHESAPQ